VLSASGLNTDAALGVTLAPKAEPASVVDAGNAGVCVRAPSVAETIHAVKAIAYAVHPHAIGAKTLDTRKTGASGALDALPIIIDHEQP